MERVGPVADWKDGAAYAPLLGADRSIFAWEWLRRDPSYRAAARASKDPASNPAAGARWGLHGFEAPARAAPVARPVWRADVHPQVLKAEARKPASPEDSFDLSLFSDLATLIRDSGEERLLLSDGLHCLRVDLVSGSWTEGPVELHYLLSGRASAKGPLLTLRRFLALDERGRFGTTLHPREPKASRWILELRAHDALAAGAGQREIAALLLSGSAAGSRWRIDAASVRSKVQRLVRSARARAKGGYRAFLG
jgi:hypothetical protein